MDPQYLTALRNRQTNSIDLPTYQILQYLYDEYGRVTPQMMQDEETKLKTMVYDPTHPIDNIFTAVEELCDLAESGGTPYTQAQCVNIAYVIINNTGEFTDAIKDWIRKPINQRSWIQFKIDFRRAHKEWKECTRKRVGDTNLSANMIQEIMQGIRQELRDIHDEYSYVDTPPPLQNFYTANASISPSTAQSSVVSSLQDEIQSLKSMIASMKSERSQYQNATIPTTCTPTTTAAANKAVITTKNGKQLKYCWTHGISTHDSKACFRRAEGHNENATVHNRLNGSMKGVTRFLKRLEDTA